MRLVVGALEPLAFVDAVWEAGSAAFGQVDAWSDVDLHAVVEPEHVSDTFAAVDAAFSNVRLGVNTWSVPEPTWHGHSQRLYQFHQADPWLVCDLAVMKNTADDLFNQPSRHGVPRVIFDRTGASKAAALDLACWRRKMRAEIAQIRARTPIVVPIVEKEARRGHLLDATGMYRSLVLTPLIVLLGMRHRPARYDFAGRYLYRDFPADDVRDLEALANVASIEELETKLELAQAWLYEMLAALDVDAIPDDAFLRLAEPGAQS